MQRLNKNFSLEVEPDTASERITRALTGKQSHGKPMTNMRNWMTAGFLLDEFGHGIMAYLLSQDDHQSPEQRRRELLHYLQYIDERKGSEPHREKERTTEKDSATEKNIVRPASPGMRLGG